MSLAFDAAVAVRNGESVTGAESLVLACVVHEAEEHERLEIGRRLGVLSPRAGVLVGEPRPPVVVGRVQGLLTERDSG